MESVQKLLKSQYDLKTAEIHSFKNHTASEDLLITDMDCVIEELEKELYSLQLSIGRLDELCVLLLDVRVFDRTRSAIASGSLFVDAIVDAIGEAAEVSHSPWSTLIPAVIGERTQDQYMSALSITLKARSDLRQAKNLARFWKTTAKQEGDHADIITPSGSTLSDVQEVLSAERQKAVDALWSKLKSGELAIRSKVVRQAQENDNSIMLPCSSPWEKASSLFIPSNSKPDLTASAAASVVTTNASLMNSSSGCSIPSTQSSGDSFIPPDSVGTGISRERSDSGTSELSPLPRLSLFSSEFWAAANDSSAYQEESGSESGSGDFTTEDALQSLKLIYNRFNTMKLNTIEKVSPTYPSTAVSPPTDPANVVTNSEDEPVPSLPDADDYHSDLEAEFVFVTIPTSSETAHPRKRTSIIQSLSFSSKLPRRLSISLSQTSSKSSSLMAKRTREIAKVKMTPRKKDGSSEMLDGKSFTGPRSGGRAATPVRSKTPIGKNSSSPASKRRERGQGVSSPSLFRPTISSSLKQSKQTTGVTSPPRIKPASPSLRSGSGITNSGGSAPFRYRSGTVPPSPARSASRNCGPASSPSPTKKTTESKSQPRTRASLQHHHPPPPIPVGRASGRGKQKAYAGYGFGTF
ncbi:hypothetical protein GYMLUDRAFT_53621 [Collybiopsis luxurians FD-317 M1]|nr:hypothetical protein GYMLUDRAFT_53621 [Collybiopsis luxurians FD-317 M1]